MKISKIGTSIFILSVLIYVASSYLKNKQLDPTYIYYPDGAVKGMTKPINDSITLYFGYDRKGKLRYASRTVNEYLDGEAKTYFSEGGLFKTETWSSGELTGPWKMYYKSGNLMSFVQLQDSMPVGNRYEYFDLPGKKVKYLGNNVNVRGKKWTNSQTWYDSLGNVVKSTVRLAQISGPRDVLLNDSLKLIFRLESLEHPLIENFVYDCDSLFNIRDSTFTYSSKSAGENVVTYIKATKLGEQVARGLIQNYKVLYRRKNGAYATESKDIYWSYKYVVKER
ncbi:toxin-antitoxin system YwqK family antitoxin [Dyadobacter sp. 22481]|uniref:toxin-antitoxin system YwqK family antitoxin n=1 Tax=Dyadobacter sp. 22481 TaxID=3453926 RepID=UPI003F8296F5